MTNPPAQNKTTFMPAVLSSSSPNSSPRSSTHGDAISRVRGVRLQAPGRWVAEIRNPVSKAKVWLGSFGTSKEAARAYDAAALAIFGPRAPVNYPASQQVGVNDTQGGQASSQSTQLSFRKRVNLYDTDKVDPERARGLKRRSSTSSTESGDSLPRLFLGPQSESVEGSGQSSPNRNPFHLLSEHLDSLSERRAPEGQQLFRLLSESGPLEGGHLVEGSGENEDAACSMVCSLAVLGSPGSREPAPSDLT